MRILIQRANHNSSVQVLKCSLPTNFPDVPKESTFHHGLKVVKSSSYVNVIWISPTSCYLGKYENMKTPEFIYEDFWWSYREQIPKDSSLSIHSCLISFHSLLHSAVIMSLLEDRLKPYCGSLFHFSGDPVPCFKFE